MANLPDPDDSEKPVSSRGLLGNWNVAPVPSLVEKKADEEEVKTTDAEDKPVYVPPGASAREDEVRKQRTEIGRGKEDGGPDANLPGLFVEEEHVVNESQARGLPYGEGESLHRLHAVKDTEAGRPRTAQAEHGAGEENPEHYRRTTPNVQEGDGDHTSDATVSRRMSDLPGD